MITAPLPRDCPACTPSNSPAASEWSSTGTASRRTRGSSDGPFGTAHERSVPSRSMRRSKCRVVASCSWTTKRDGTDRTPSRYGPNRSVRIHAGSSAVLEQERRSPSRRSRCEPQTYAVIAPAAAPAISAASMRPVWPVHPAGGSRV